MADPQWVGNAIIAASTITASALTFIGTYLINKNNNKKDLNRLQLNINWEREKLDREIQRKNQLEKYSIYNKILKTDGEVVVQTSYPVEFHFKNYRDNIRPLLYVEFHLLDQDVKNVVRTMDQIISLCDFLGEVQNEHQEKLLELYNILIDSISKHYEDQ